MMKTIMALATLLILAPVWAGDLEVDNLTVSNSAVFYGQMNFYSISGTTTNPVTITGGTITTNGNYTIHTFTNIGATNFVVFGGSLTCDVLVVAGGGGGSRWEGGGGGGGGVILTNEPISKLEN